MKNIIKVVVFGCFVVFNNYGFSQCSCDDIKIFELKDTISFGKPYFTLKLTTKDSCGIGGGGGYSDFWFINQTGDTINQYTGSGMWLPNPSDPMFDTTEYIIQLKPGYSNFPINFSGYFQICAPNCTIPFTYSNLTTTEKIELKSLIQIFPNPSNDVVRISNKSDFIITSIELYNSSGKLIRIKSFGLYEVDVSDFDSGVYFIKIYSNGKVVTTEKVIKN